MQTAHGEQERTKAEEEEGMAFVRAIIKNVRLTLFELMRNGELENNQTETES